ncbi:hypothetical protein AMS68_004084 [Peltaster fructicola]|uniref:Uncharacterized protein n=1 Tax=Peltaster fructicola TaxID=286661 RepID=A0A6H0XUY2_9PEZI|nr:hypothetical protein AMS68_004084 [Peltaster fructicola]
MADLTDAGAGKAFALRDTTSQQPSRKRKRDSVDNHTSERRYSKAEAKIHPAAPTSSKHNTLGAAKIIPGKLPYRKFKEAMPYRSQLAGSLVEEEDADSMEAAMPPGSRIPEVQHKSAFRLPRVVSQEQESNKGGIGMMSRYYFGLGGTDTRADSPVDEQEPSSHITVSSPADSSEDDLFVPMSKGSPKPSRDTSAANGRSTMLSAASTLRGSSEPRPEMDSRVPSACDDEPNEEYTSESLRDQAEDDDGDLDSEQPLEGPLVEDTVVLSLRSISLKIEEISRINASDKAEMMVFLERVAYEYSQKCREIHELDMKFNKLEQNTNSKLRFMYNLIQSQRSVDLSDAGVEES